MQCKYLEKKSVCYAKVEFTQDTAKETVTNYIRGMQLISSKQGSNENFYTYNGHGDVVQLTSSTGSITKQYAYDAFGIEKTRMKPIPTRSDIAANIWIMKAD